jgi:hypothetical protein
MDKLTLYIILFFFAFSSCQQEFLIAENEHHTLGSAAKDILTAEKYTALEIDISYMQGYKPDAASLINLHSFLSTYLNKPDGIIIKQKEVPATGKTTLSLDEVVHLEKKYRSSFSRANTIAIHILITDADFRGTGDLALSYWNTSFALFGSSVYDYAGYDAEIKSRLLTTLLQHEFGHLLGLVGQGSPMQQPHKDEENGAHCDNPTCLMYYIVEYPTGPVNVIPKLDAHCIADLKANGGK